MRPVAHPNVDLVVAHLRAGGASPRAVEGMRVLPDAVTTAAAAVAALGVEVGQIANSLVFDADGTPLLVLTSGAHRVDTGKVAARIDARRVRPALASLSPVQREAVTLMYFERRTMKEISIQLRLPLGTVKTRIRDGLISLRHAVDQTALPDAQSRKTSMLAPSALSRLARSS